MEQPNGTIAEDQSANRNLADTSVADTSGADGKSASNKPNKWLAMVLAFVYPPLGLVYAVQPTAAALYLIVGGMLMRYVSADRHSPLMLAIVMTLSIRVVAMTHAYIAAVQYPEDKRRPYYSRGPFAVVLNVAVVLLVVGVNVALVMMAYRA